MIDGGLRQLFREHIPGHWQSVETGGTGRGTPDSNFCAAGVEGWVEYKQCTGGLCVPLRPEQVAWIHRRQRAGGRVFVAVRLKHGGGPRKGGPTDELWLMRGDPICIRERGLTAEGPWVLGRWLGGPAGWRWDIVRQLITDPLKHL